MHDKPDAAAAVVYTDRARQALDTSRIYLAHANAVMEQADPDDLAGDVRRRVYENLLDCANTYERLSDDYRERAHDAQQLRRRRYDNTISVADVAEGILRGGAA